MAKAHENDFGLLLCQNCGTEVICDENGDMPEKCPGCSAPLDYSSYTKEA